MRIIDKNTDFYDFWQGVYPDNSITFDRTDSFLLTKEIFCEHLSFVTSYPRHGRKQNFCLLQVCHSFWLFLTDITDTTKCGFPKDYTVELLATWKNYNSQRRLIRLDLIDFDWYVCSGLYIGMGDHTYDMEKVRGRIQTLIQAVDTGNLRVRASIDRHMIRKDGGEQIEKHIPLLKACGIGSCMESLDIFLAFEEYFSLEKSSAEKTDSVGLTDHEKIGNHGFDTKTSFRGKSVDKAELSGAVKQFQTLSGKQKEFRNR